MPQPAPPSWQHVPDGSGGCRRCGPQIIARRGCVPTKGRAPLRPCPGGFASAGYPCGCNGDAPGHYPRPVAEAFADPSSPVLVDVGLGETRNGKLQTPVRFAWAGPLASDEAEDWLEDDGGRF